MKREKELLDELRRGPARLERAQATAIVAYWLAIAFFLGNGFVVFRFVPQQFLTVTTIGVWVLFTQVIVVVAAIIRTNLEVGGPKALEERQKKLVDLIVQLRLLREQNPELLLLNEVSEALEDERARTESRRSFWMNIWVNVFFTLLGTVLGFVLSYSAAVFGWLR